MIPVALAADGRLSRPDYPVEGVETVEASDCYWRETGHRDPSSPSPALTHCGSWERQLSAAPFLLQTNGDAREPNCRRLPKRFTETLSRNGRTLRQQAAAAAAFRPRGYRERYCGPAARRRQRGNLPVSAAKSPWHRPARSSPPVQLLAGRWISPTLRQSP
jgi:hypothetical protein